MPRSNSPIAWARSATTHQRRTAAADILEAEAAKSKTRSTPPTAVAATATATRSTTTAAVVTVAVTTAKRRMAPSVSSRASLMMVSALFVLLASGWWPHLASAAPTPQSEGGVFTGQGDDSAASSADQPEAEQQFDAAAYGQDAASELRYGWWSSVESRIQPAEPPDISPANAIPTSTSTSTTTSSSSSNTPDHLARSDDSRHDGELLRPVAQHNSQSSPTIHIIDNANNFHAEPSFYSVFPISSDLPDLLSSSGGPYGGGGGEQHDLAQDEPSSPAPASDAALPTAASTERTITPRGVEPDDAGEQQQQQRQPNWRSETSEAHWVYNMVIQQQRLQRSAFIAPDVHWLRQLVPKVVDVADKPETHIKEAVFSAIDDEASVRSSDMQDRQLFVNVVKSSVQSEAEVQQILGRLRDLMQTGGPAVDTIRAQSRQDDVPRRTLVINIIIFNVAPEQVAVVEKPTVDASPVAAQAPVTATFFRDSYLEALHESRGTAAKSPPKAKPHHGPHFVSTSFQRPSATSDTIYLSGSSSDSYLHNHNADDYSSTTRPLTAMEKDYLRPVHPIDQPVETDAQLDDYDYDDTGVAQSAPPFFAALADQQTLPASVPQKQKPPHQASEPDSVTVNAANAVKVVNVVNKPAVGVPVRGTPIVQRIPAAMAALTNTAGNVVRNRVRTLGFVAVPIMAGLASTVNVWLPAMAALGRKKRSLPDEGAEQGEDLSPYIDTDQYRSFGDRLHEPKAIDDESVLALLMGKRYLNISRESLQESIDNWKNRDQESGSSSGSASGAGQLLQQDAAKLSSTSKPLWFRLQPQNKVQEVVLQATPATTTSFGYDYETTVPTVKTTVKRSTDAVEAQVTSTTRKYPFFPFFYSTLFKGQKKPETQQAQVVADVDFTSREEESTSESVWQDATADEDISSPVTSTDPSDYATTDTEERTIGLHPVTVSAFPQGTSSSSGFDFDIVANFVKSTLSKMVAENTRSPDEDLFSLKSPSIVNSNNNNSSLASSTLLFKIASTRAPSITLSSITKPFEPVSVFAADPLMPSTDKDERATNSPVTYVSIRPAPLASSFSVVKQPAKRPTSTEAVLDSSSELPLSENVGEVLQFYDDETSSAYYTKEVPSQTVTYSEPFLRSTKRPLPSNLFFDSQQLSNTVRPIVASDSVSSSSSSSSTTGSTRPASLLTIAHFKTPRPPASVDISSNGAPLTTIKLPPNHGGIVTTAPLQDFSTLTGESALVSATVDKQNILAGLLKGSNAAAGVSDEDGATPSMEETDTNYGGSTEWFGSSGTSFNPAFDTATYDPFSTTGISDELDVTSLITQLKSNLTTGLVTKPPAGLHFVNTSTDIVIINPFDVTPSSVFGPFGVEAAVDENGVPIRPVVEAVVVESADPPPGEAPSNAAPAVSPLANLFFSSGSSSSGSSSGSSSSSSGSSSGSSSSGIISSLNVASGLSSAAVLGGLAMAAVTVLALSLPIWVPFVAKKKRRTYGPSSKKKTYKPANNKKKKKTYGAPRPPKKTYGEPPPNHYKDLDERYSDDIDRLPLAADEVYEGASPVEASLFNTEEEDLYGGGLGALQSEDAFHSPGPLDSEDLYGPPATIFLNTRRRRRSASPSPLRRPHRK